jgi:cytochrome b6-f complex iron-sulfur subunit
MNRRELIRNLSTGSVALFFVPALLNSCEKATISPDDGSNPNGNKLTIDLADNKYSALLSAGGFYIEHGIIVINSGAAYIALSSECTHQGCQVSYSQSDDNLPCPCHGSIFSTTGSVLQGPANTPLKKYDVSVEGDILTIVL